MEEKNIVDLFIKACRDFGGEILEDRDGVKCVVDSEGEYIKIHKSGEWVKVYEHDPESNYLVLKTWAKPKEIEYGRFKTKRLKFDLEKGARFSEVEKSFIEIEIEGSPCPIYVESDGVFVGLRAPNYIDPEFMETLRRKREAIKRATLERIRKSK